MPAERKIDPRTEKSVWIRGDGSEISLNNFKATIAEAKRLKWKRKKDQKKD